MICITDNCKYPAKVYINNNKDELIVFVLLLQLRIIIIDTLDGKLKVTIFQALCNFEILCHTRYHLKYLFTTMVAFLLLIQGSKLPNGCFQAGCDISPPPVFNSL